MLYNVNVAYWIYRSRLDTHEDWQCQGQQESEEVVDRTGDEGIGVKLAIP